LSTDAAAQADAPRYAIYFVPAVETALYRFGSGFLGYDSYSGRDLGPPPDLDMDASAWADLTREPRKYGFHATLKAPFRLRPQFMQADLLAALDQFARVPRPIPTLFPMVAAIDRFVALVPQRPCPALDRLAADCVTAFDDFRAPLSPQERRNRINAGLAARQIENLDRWGYPYVLDEFRFHMTLTGPLDDARRGAITAFLRERFETIGGHPLSLDSIALLRRDAGSAPFRVIGRSPLTDQPSAR
jgi:putative phosphonate metabolism protein